MFRMLCLGSVSLGFRSSLVFVWLGYGTCSEVRGPGACCLRLLRL